MRVLTDATGRFLFFLCLLTFFALQEPRSGYSASQEDPRSLLYEEYFLQAPVEDLVQLGKFVAFGTLTPELHKDDLPIGRGQCPLCHQFFAWQMVDRGPSLIGMEALSHQRVKEERYKMFVQRLGKEGDPITGFKPHAKTGGEFMIEHAYCPSCYVPVGFGVTGSNDLESPTAIFNRPPLSLTDVEIVAVIAYVQSFETPGDYSKVTAKRDWENYFGKELKASVTATPGNEREVFLRQIAIAKDSPEEIILRMACQACHKIPTIRQAQIGMIGPLLITKSSAAKRIQSPEYQKAVKEGRAHATTPREYVMESILQPSVFIVPGFPDAMVKDYGHKFTVRALEKLVDFLLTLDEDTARASNLDRLPNEKEGSLFK